MRKLKAWEKWLIGFYASVMIPLFLAVANPTYGFFSMLPCFPIAIVCVTNMIWSMK